ncbi:hypothetical protein MRX96_027013 [Rhipicephalus microplus]
MDARECRETSFEAAGYGDRSAIYELHGELTEDPLAAAGISVAALGRRVTTTVRCIKTTQVVLFVVAF